jgi:aspartate oxidase
MKNNNYKIPCFCETIIFGSGISAYFAKKINPNALVISDKAHTKTIISNGFFRTKGIPGKSFYNSIIETGYGLNNKKLVNNFCNFTKKMKKLEEFNKSKKWRFGFIQDLGFIKKFEEDEKECVFGRLIKIVVSNGKVSSVIVDFSQNKKNSVLKKVFCKNIILCTGGFSQYFVCPSNPTGIELAFESGAKVSNLEFVFYHPFAIAKTKKIIPTESLKKAKMFDFSGKRLFKLEKVLSEKNAHHLLSKIVKEYYSKNNHLYADFSGKKIKLCATPYCTLGGLVVNSKMRTNISGLFAVGESATGVNGADRIGGVSLSWGVYSGIIAGKETSIGEETSILSNKKQINLENFGLEKNTREKSTGCEKKLKIKKNFLSNKTFLNNFSYLNDKKQLSVGLEDAKKQNNLFAIKFYESALKRNKSMGCFILKE